MEKTLSEQFQEYKLRYNGNPKHDFEHFLITMSNLRFHRDNIRPKIGWWQELKRLMKNN